ncbi:MAG: carbamoyl-phosphate synthase (glutamine-hydrolyzing) large subunit [Xanthomonadaceae bacterium]|nr:carbamoyl-phosphate synthase (glutamine-hydrolyzing) large subunit [Xanthomonadaceae bacterium]
MKGKPKKVLVLGSGALKIAQAGEFDYSGSQAIKVLREEGIKSVLINPNIATIQTDDGMADEVYFLPVTPYFVEKVLEKEKCDAVFLSFGGQTALNCGLELEKSGVFKRLGVEVLGTPVRAIRDTEDRHLFIQRLDEIGVVTAKSKAIESVDDAVKTAREIGYPVMLRAGFSLGGQGSGLVYNDEQCKQMAETAFATVSQILIEECLSGWKEIEYEVVRDGADNCITVCNMENVDPMGVHTGESIVIAPSQTLDDNEYQMLRNVAIKTIRHLGIVGECNIQYALNPHNREYRVIEVNARLSRSSALASKATGYPLAYVAAKIALGYKLFEIANQVTKVTTAFFEPALDYIVCKFPRWDLTKFPGADTRIGSEMKSVGEVMAIGRSFPEVLQKAIRMTEIGALGLDPDAFQFDDLQKELREPTHRRMFALAKAFEQGMTVSHIQELTGMDPFFLHEIERVVKLGQSLKGRKVESIEKNEMNILKRAGFSDTYLAKLTQTNDLSVRKARLALGVKPHLSQIDTLAAEYPANTNFLYYTYAAEQHDIQPSTKPTALVLGSGCYRIGSSVEFDWCAVSAVKTLKNLGYDVILLNCNPETVSTDFDVCEKLIFDEISMEMVLETVDFANPIGVFVSMGGQTPNNIALKLAKAGVKLIGTSAESIDMAEDRSKFSKLLDELNVYQPKWATATDMSVIDTTVEELGGFPILVRPSYVLSGAAMKVAWTMDELKGYLKSATDVSSEHPVVMTKFEEDSREIEFDGVAKNGEIILSAITEHIENAGVHSGDATLIIPPQRITIDVLGMTTKVAKKLAKALNITGPFNIQLLNQNHEVRVIECNLRASRSFPFISKAMRVNFISEATKAMMSDVNEKPVMVDAPGLIDLEYVCVKSPQFSYSRIKNADPINGVEMHSTGEAGCFGKNAKEALLKAMISTGFKIPKKGILLTLDSNQPLDLGLSIDLHTAQESGLKIYICGGKSGTKTRATFPIESMSEGEALELIASKTVDLVISLSRKDHYKVRRLAVDTGSSLITDHWLARRAIQGFNKYDMSELRIEPWSSYGGIAPSAS